MKTLLPFLICLSIATSQLRAQVENALHFDGLDDNITVAGASSLISGVNQISLSFWVYPENTVTSFPDYDGFCGIRNNIDADFYLVQIYGNLVEARFRNSLGVNYDIIDSGLQINTWQHYVLTYDGAELALFRNAQLVRSIAATGTINLATEDLHIGNLLYQGTNYYLTGMIDEVSFWNKAVPASEILCIYKSYVNTTSPGLLLYYKFNQGMSGGINTGIDTLVPQIGSLPGTMHNFSLFGTTSNWVDGLENYTGITDFVCAGQIYTFGSQSLTSPGIYYEAFPGPFGCDSIVRLALNAGVDTSITQSLSTLSSNQNGGTYQWIDCNNGNIPISGANAQSYTPSANGSYAVIVTNGACTDTSECYSIVNTGISNPLNERIKLYPNPATSFFQIIGIEKEYTMEIFDIHGQLIKVFADEKGYDISELSKGLYLVKLIAEDGVFVRTLVK